MADRKELKTVKRGRPKKENRANNVCRVCETNLWVMYGSSTAKSFLNLFKPSLRDESFGAPYCCISLFIKNYVKMRTRLPKVGM